jgi:hypothetical protein
MHSVSPQQMVRRAGRLGAAAVLVGAAFVVVASPAAASQFTVTTTADSGAGSLRQAVIDANANSGPDEIVFDSSIDGQTITLTTGELAVSDDLTVTGNGATNTIIDGNAAGRIFAPGSVAFTISGTTLQDGAASGNGGAIDADGAITVDSTVVTDNTASLGGGGVSAAAVIVRNGSVVRASHAVAGSGGGVLAQSGDVTVTDSTIGGSAPSEANSAAGAGGGLSAAAGTATITSSTVSHNTATGGAGGGIDAATVVVGGSTIADNAACCAPGDNGGGINSGALTISDSTISSNSAFAGGGASVVSPTLVTITGSWFDQNVASVAGGGIANIGALTQTMSISNSTFSANQETASGFFSSGGGAIATSDADATISNVTINGNTAAGRDGGGGILIQTFNAPSTNTVSVESSTIDGNSAPSGAGIAVGTDLPAPSVTSTILSNSAGPSCDGTITDNGFNALFNTTAGSCVFGASNDVTGADPQLSALTLNAPATLVPTMVLSATSPALDVVTTGCPPPATDARGVTRPQGDACDIGAFELEVIPPPPTTTTTTTTTTTSTTTTTTPTISVAPAGAVESSGGSGTPPATGFPAPGLALLGFTFLAVGALVELATRRSFGIRPRSRD